MTDPLTSTARFLADHVEWMRHRPEADEFLASIEAASRLITGIIDGAPPRVYLGPCVALVETDDPCPVNCACHNGPDYTCDEPGGCGSAGCGRMECTGDVYARQGQRLAHCRSCGAEVDVADRKAWLDETVGAHTFRAKYLADAFGINVNTIRSWYLRGKLWPAPDPEVFQPSRVEDLLYEDDKPLFRVGEVLDLAAADALRRAENEAKRAMREVEAA